MTIHVLRPVQIGLPSSYYQLETLDFCRGVVNHVHASLHIGFWNINDALGKVAGGKIRKKCGLLPNPPRTPLDVDVLCPFLSHFRPFDPFLDHQKQFGFQLPSLSPLLW